MLVNSTALRVASQTKQWRSAKVFGAIFGDGGVGATNAASERTGRCDVRRFSSGERIVFLPYGEDVYAKTQAWIRERGIFDAQTSVNAIMNVVSTILRKPSCSRT